MRKGAQDQLAMLSRLVDFLTEYATGVAASERAAQQATVVTTGYAQLSGAQGQTARRTKTLTDAGKQAKKDLLDLLPALLGPLGRAATRLQDNALLAAATLSGKQLRKLRPLALLSVADAVLAGAARADVASELGKQGLTKPALKPLHDQVEAYRQAQSAPRKTIDERKLAGEAVETQLGEVMDEVRELDQDMKAFKLLNRKLYAGYLQAREIINSGGGKGDGGLDTSAQPGT